jgi:hypothetical protein
MRRAKTGRNGVHTPVLPPGVIGATVREKGEAAMVVAKWIAGVGLALVAAGTAGAGTPTFPANATGDWRGMVQAKDASRHLFLHVHKTRAGDYVATLNSPEREPGALPVTPIAAEDGVLAFAADGGQFRGQWSQVNGRWEGTWTEAGVSAPLVLSMNVDSTAPRIATSPDVVTILQGLPPIQPSATAPPEIVPPAAR